METIQESKEKMRERVQRASILKSKTKNQKECEHTYEDFSETIVPTNDSFNGTAYFIVKGCLKCHDKRRISLVVNV